MRVPLALRRQILHLHYVQRQSCEQIDSDLGLPEGTAASVVGASVTR